MKQLSKLWLRFLFQMGERPLLKWHLLFWFVYFAVLWIGNAIKFPHHNVLNVLAAFVLKVPIFYGIFYFLPLLLNRNNWYRGLAFLVVFFFLSVPFSYLYLYECLYPLGIRYSAAKASFDWGFVGRMVNRFLLLWVLASGLYFAIKKAFPKVNKENPMLRKPINVALDLGGNIFVKYGKLQHLKVSLKDILHIGTDLKRTKIFTAEREIFVDDTLSELEERLPADHFVRIAKSNIVNVAHINVIKANEVILSDGAVIKIGAKYKENIEAIINK